MAEKTENHSFKDHESNEDENLREMQEIKPFVNKGTIWVNDEISDFIHSVITTTSGKYSIKWRKVLEQHGIFVRRGKWIKEEDDILRNNWTKYCKSNPRIDAKQFLCVNKCYSKEKRYKLNQDIRDTDFCGILSKNLNRLSYSCVLRAQRLFRTWKRGSLIDTEVQLIENFRGQFGFGFTKIAHILGRYPNCLHQQWYHMKTGIKRGKWSNKEIDQLIKSVRKVTGTNDFENIDHKKMPWVQIAKGVPERSGIQCRMAWLHSRKVLRRRANIRHTNNNTNVIWTKRDKIKLIETIYCLDITQEAEIDWEELLPKFPNCPSPQYLQGKWHSIKTKLTNCITMTFEEVRDKVYSDLNGQIEK